MRACPAAAIALLLLACGGGGGGGSQPAPVVTVTVSGPTTPLQAGATAQFTATVTGTSNTAVTWSVDPIGPVNVGTVSATGLYTAPAAAGTFTVRATSAADTSKSGSAQVTVLAPAIAVSISPAAPSTATGGSLQLSASVTGTTNGAVTWDLPGGAATGTLVSTGPANATYTAPALPGAYAVRATSAADAGKSATVNVVVSQGTGFRISGTPRIAPNTSSQFTALFNDTPVEALWAFEGPANGCTISASGLFTAGAANTTVTVRATDAAQPGRTATTLVTVASQVVLLLVGPAAPTLTTADMVTFYPSVSPSGVSPEVTWSTSPASTGSNIPVDWFRGYLPPPAPGTVTVTGTSVADPTVTASFTATVTAAAGPAFSPTGSAPASPRYEHAAATLPDGRVLLVGGFRHRASYSPLATSEVYTPATGAFTAGPALQVPRMQAEALALDANRVLVTGGYESYELAHTSAEVVDLGAGTSAPAANAMSARRLFHQMVRLTTGPNAGRIAVLGGFNGPIPYGVPSWQSSATVDLFDGGTLAFSPFPASMKAPRGLFTATPLLDGRILIAGGFDAGTFTTHASAEIFDPVAGTFTFTGTMARARAAHTATRLADGKVLVVGGIGDAVEGATAELYNPATGLFEPVNGSMAVSRRHHAAALLADGRVGVFGGESQDNWVRGTAEAFDPVLKTFSPLGRMSIPRRRPTASVLTTGPQAGKVLIFGGGAENKISGAAEIDP